MTGVLRVPARSSRTRTLVIDGVLWTVGEIPPTRGGDGRADLMFASEHAVRRVRAYPDHWMTLGDLALFAVSFSR